ncbi:MAG TPA: APC family permease [Acidimicrobiales bacterium]|nr:APC family permease [Acidimicrobiales bacterium]
MAHVQKTPTSDYERLGARRLGLADVVAQSVGFLGPVFSAAFLVPLVVGIISATGKGGGGAAPLSVIIAAVGVVALGWLVSRYARQVHAAGGLYDYVSRGLGERAGVAAGILYYAGILLLSVGLIVLVGGYVHDTVLSEFNKTPLPIWAWSAILIALVLGVLYTGVRISTRAQLVLALVSLLVVTGFFVMVIVKLGHQNSWSPFKPSSSAQGWSGIFFGVLYGVLLFVGFETAANLGEEAKEPKRMIPIAVIATALIAAAFYVLATYAQLAGFHFNLTAMGANAGGPLFALGGPGPLGYGSVWIRRLLELVVLFDMVAVALGTGVASTRGIFALARDRRLPAPLASVSRRRGTPVGAIVVLGVLAAANVVIASDWTRLFALPNTPHYFAIFAWDSTFGGFALVVVYLLMCVGSIRSFLPAPGRLLAMLAALVGIAITGGAIYASFYKVAKPTIYAPYAALGVLVVGIVIAVATKGRTPAAMHLEDLAVNPELARLEPLTVATPQSPGHLIGSTEPAPPGEGLLPGRLPD